MNELAQITIIVSGGVLGNDKKKRTVAKCKDIPRSRHVRADSRHCKSSAIL